MKKQKKLILVLLPFALYLFLFLNTSAGSTKLDYISVNEKNGDVAIAYTEYGYSVVRLFNRQGEELYKRRDDNNGGTVCKLFFDETNCLHAQYTRIGVEKNFDAVGNVIDTQPFEVQATDEWAGWKKKGASYSKQVGANTYRYTYSTFYNFLWTKDEIFWVEDEAGNRMVLWSETRPKIINFFD